jgi:hypothetical protein
MSLGGQLVLVSACLTANPLITDGQNTHTHTHTLYESNMGTGGLMDGKVKELLVNQGQAIVFCSSFCHAGGSNYSINQTGYVYCLFAFIVLLESIILPMSEQGSNIEA